MNGTRHKFDRPAPRGFTLIELMVSIALVLILILGINQVFKIASDTVNVGLAMSGAAREDRGIQGTLYPDVQNMVLTEAPFFVIRSRIQPAFRSRADEQADSDGDPYTVDIDGNNTEGEGTPGEKISPITYNARNHRVDKLIFFANYLYRRQTGNGASGELISGGSSNEAYITYGHLKVGKNHANITTPDDYSRPGQAGASATALNDNNRYATDWILGRNVTLLTEAAMAGQIRRAGVGLAPLVESAKSDNSRYFFTNSVYDVAQTSISGFRDIVSDPRNWGAAGEPWWQTVSGFRFQTYPYPKRPMTPETIAQTVPVFVRGCTQFIVEYAGDYLVQDPITGNIMGSVFGPPGVGDNVIDFAVVPTPGSTGAGARRTRWYGAPRNVDTSDDQAGLPVVRGTGQVAMMRDVVPLRDVLKSAGITPPPDFFERDIDNRMAARPNYAAMQATTGGRSTNAGLAVWESPLMGTDANEYVAAWGPGSTAGSHDLGKGSLTKPKMLRITIVVDDPAGRLADGQTYEYVFTLP